MNNMNWSPQQYEALQSVARWWAQGDTWLVGGPDLKAMSGSVESNRVIQLHFHRPGNDKDRAWLLEAINEKILSEQRRDERRP